MAVINFYEERYNETKKIADSLLQLVHLIETDSVITREQIITELRKREFKCRQKAFEYQKKMK